MRRAHQSRSRNWSSPSNLSSAARTEFVRSIAQNNNDWAQAWLDFNNRISEVLTPAAESAADEPTPIKKPSSARGSKA